MSNEREIQALERNGENRTPEQEERLQLLRGQDQRPPVTSEVVLRTYKAVEELAKQLREEAKAEFGKWGAIKSLEAAMYDLWGAYGYLALEEEGRGHG